MKKYFKSFFTKHLTSISLLSTFDSSKQKTTMTDDLMPVILWLACLPEPYQSKAIANCMTIGCESCDTLYPAMDTSLENAVYSAFTWSNSPEGHIYWSDLAYKISKLK